MQAGNDAVTAEGSAGIGHDSDPAVAEDVRSEGLGCCVVGLFDGDDIIPFACTPAAKTATAMISAFSGRPGYKH